MEISREWLITRAFHFSSTWLKEEYMSSCEHELLFLIRSNQHFTFHFLYTSHLSNWNDNLLYNSNRPNAWSIDGAVNTIMTCAAVTVPTVAFATLRFREDGELCDDTLRREHRAGRSRRCQIFPLNLAVQRLIAHTHTFSAFLRLVNIFTGPPLKQLY
jgi:hypothetical protein